MTTRNDHAVIHITIDDPIQLVGFLIQEGNCLLAKELYEQVIFEDRSITDVEEAAELMRGAKVIMETAGFTCGEILTQTKVEWLELLFERPLTDSERDSINNPCESHFDE